MRNTMLSVVVVSAVLSTIGSAQNNPTKDFRIRRFFPTIVAQVALTGQTASIPKTTLLTPKRNGLYRISLYAVPTATVGESAVDFQFMYGDDAGQEFITFSILANSVIGCVGNGCSFTSIARDNAGVPLTFYAAVPSDSQITYDLFITVEQLQ
jgi:hypothetical protein